MKIRRFFSLVMATVMGLSLAGCGGAPRETSGPDTLSANIELDPDPEPESLPAFAALFRKDTPSVEAKAGEIAKAVYPVTPAYPKEEDYFQPGGMGYDAYSKDYEAWLAYDYARPELTADELNALRPFFRASVQQFLSDDGNRVCSPLNIYMALSMLSGLTAGDSQAQILTLLGATDADALRSQANRIWNALYNDDGVSTTILGSSLWLNESVKFNADTLKQLSESVYASSYAGKMGSPEFNAALQAWLNEQTRGLLSEQAGSVEMTPETLLALATTIYFKANWQDEFSKGATAPDTFHALDGDCTAPFMRQTFTGAYYKGDGFTAVEKRLRGSGMWLILPDEGKTPADLLNSGAAMDFLSATDKAVETPRADIQLALPKFDVSSDLNLIAGLKALGVTDVFDGAVSDFSPMTADTEEIAIGQAKHAARVKIDEEGCEAAAFTVMMMELTAMMDPLPVIPFTLDRPFVFAVTDDSGLPLFVGAVQTPADA